MGIDIREEWHGDRIDLRRAGRRGTLSAAQRLLGISLPKVPLDTSALRSSGKARQVQRGGDEAAAEVSYETEYAVIQHERLDYNHDEGQAKYLEEPLRESRAELLAIIAQAIREGLIRS